jgi:hypothetical protein
MMGGAQQQGRGFGPGGGIGGMSGMGQGLRGRGGQFDRMGRGIGGRGGGLLGLVSLATQSVGDRGQHRDNYNNRSNPPAPYSRSPGYSSSQESPYDQNYVPAPDGGSNFGYYDERRGCKQQYQQAGAGAGAGGVLSLNKLFSSVRPSLILHLIAGLIDTDICIQKVLYLMVVNMPTDEEMAQAQRLTADWNIQAEPQQF